MYNFTKPTCSLTAITFLIELHKADLMFHPDDSPQGCDFGRELPSLMLAMMDQYMEATHHYLEDPSAIVCEIDKAPVQRQEQPVSRASNVLSVLDLSTAHLSPKTLAMLGEKTPETFPLYGGNLMNGLFVSASKDYDYSGEKLPIDLLSCLTAAWAQDCSHILFDCDGPIDESLYAYSHDGSE
ncbi:hypothetical protein PsAD46_03459 [Pseudovibrio sp. Ad46]|uniref:DUF5983 family protein n=1 Tax=unclassified Pseudovibrio TaxID=2627060 RepID=UPI0007AE93D7|nr:MULTISPECIES: hypothetical protein [unclassified Pseudovibrio]KZK84199.1 hypothetical protein PsAD46_03459 [Pseudovibrio sp. Ad46]KZK98936.1 hypothetical protein PsAD5_01559 [Pseudovibrio sp. Ad5]